MFEIVLDDGGMNLLSSAMLRQIRAQLPTSGELLVLRSGRPHIFAAGADMAEMRAFSAQDAEAFAGLGQELFETIEKLPLITVALIDGDCFGGALDLTLAFDLRLATPRSRFAHPGARLGIVTGFGGTSRWRKTLERAAARRLFLGNEVLSAQQAMELGLVDRVAESFDDELARLQSLDAATARVMKELVRHAETLTKDQLMLLAGRLHDLHK